MRRVELQKKAEASLSPRNLWKAAQRWQRKTSYKKATSVGGGPGEGAELWGGTPQEFFSPSDMFYEINFGIINRRMWRDQRAQRALSLAVHSGWSPSCTLPEGTI